MARLSQIQYYLMLNFFSWIFSLNSKTIIINFIISRGYTFIQFKIQNASLKPFSFFINEEKMKRQSWYPKNAVI